MLAEKLLSWYSENGRHLPWRETHNPYFIWLSEIILQQTRIQQGMSYYFHFIHQYPTVGDLAEASEEQVLKSWQGLGYYSRARNMHAAAKYIAEDLKGEFPNTYKGILSLKGVGPYTAAAIASFAFCLPYPVIDGNVYRFVSRLYGIYTPIGTKQAYDEFEERLTRLIDREHPDNFNQAIMDFGSLYCKPTGCDCSNCIFAQECVARNTDKVEYLPVRMEKTQPKERFFYYFDVRWQEDEEMMLVHRRDAGDIWQGLYELPLYEAEASIESSQLSGKISELMEEWFGESPVGVEWVSSYQHQLTHRTIKAQFFQVKMESTPMKMPQNLKAIPCSQLKILPISRLIDRYLSRL